MRAVRWCCVMGCMFLGRGAQLGAPRVWAAQPSAESSSEKGSRLLDGGGSQRSAACEWGRAGWPLPGALKVGSLACRFGMLWPLDTLVGVQQGGLVSTCMTSLPPQALKSTVVLARAVAVLALQLRPPAWRICAAPPSGTVCRVCWIGQGGHEGLR
jgi:hypothetical protein